VSEYDSLHFAHPAYQFETCYRERGLTGKAFQTWTTEDTAAQIGRAKVFIGSGFWRNEFLDAAPDLKYVHVGAVGFDNFDVAAIRARGIRLCNSGGVNRNAVADHGMALILSLTRQLHTARDRQRNAQWRGMISDIPKREDELAGKTLLIYGLGGIGGRLARLAKAFDMRVVGIKRDTANRPDNVDALHGPDQFLGALAEADVVALTCPLTDQTRGLMDRAALAAMKPSAYLINLARGAVVDEGALVAALADHRIAGAGLDVFDPEPLPSQSKLWGFETVVITPHTGGETQAYERNVIDLLAENLKRLANGESELLNQIV
jgi:phosphoglycerate dehydrogenase-like enzyme